MTAAQQVLIIGASRGIGLELARQYRQHGSRVTATARSEAGLARIFHGVRSKAEPRGFLR